MFAASPSMAGTLVQSNLDKIEDFLQDAQYQSLMVNSASYNVRIMRERKARLPFWDSQTGQAQSPVRQTLLARHRLPTCTVPGQVYRYPAQPWRRRHRSYLERQHQQILQKKAAQEAESSEHTIITVENPAAGVQNITNGDDLIDKEAFYYEETAVFLDEDEDDLDNTEDDFDDDTYGARKRKKGSKTKKSKSSSRGSSSARKKREGGSGTAQATTAAASAARSTVPVDPDDPNAKPYECQRCSARYKTRQGLSYHMSHTHKGDNSPSSAQANITGSADVAPLTGIASHPKPSSDPSMCVTPPSHSPAPAVLDPLRLPPEPHIGASPYEAAYKDYLSAAGAGAYSSGTGNGRAVGAGKKTGRSRKSSKDHSVSYGEFNPTKQDDHRSSRHNSFVATPNPYCDFCLGDSRYNKKTGAPEQMVSCSDCGRSGHPSCLQFTTRMMEAVKRYRWQCIECKCCTLCGTAENDDQLLFCDDCDRGYHLYCVRPPLAEPPEGEWACHLCVQLGN